MKRLTLRVAFGANFRPRILLTIKGMLVSADLISESIDCVEDHSVFIVGRAGPSGSGKSTVAKRVASRLKGHVLSMESYSIVMNNLSLEERAKQDYDAPHAIDVKLLESHIRDYAAGHAIEIPICDFAKHLRVARTYSSHVLADSRRHIGFAFCPTSPAL
jgi:pantothenate kinase